MDTLLPDEIEWTEPKVGIFSIRHLARPGVKTELTYAQKVKKNEDKFDRTIEKVLARDLNEETTMKLINKALDR